jgi:hypothetical protein
VRVGVGFHMHASAKKQRQGLVSVLVDRYAGYGWVRWIRREFWTLRQRTALGTGTAWNREPNGKVGQPTSKTGVPATAACGHRHGTGKLGTQVDVTKRAPFRLLQLHSMLAGCSLHLEKEAQTRNWRTQPPASLQILQHWLRPSLRCGAMPWELRGLGRAPHRRGLGIATALVVA